MLYHIRHIRH